MTQKRPDDGLYRLTAPLIGVDKRFRNEVLTFRSGLPAGTLVVVETATVARGNRAQTVSEVRVALTGDVVRLVDVLDRLVMVPATSATPFEYARADGFDEAASTAIEILMRAEYKYRVALDIVARALESTEPPNTLLPIEQFTMLLPSSNDRHDSPRGPSPATPSASRDAETSVESVSEPASGRRSKPRP